MPVNHTSKFTAIKGILQLLKVKQWLNIQTYVMSILEITWFRKRVPQSGSYATHWHTGNGSNLIKWYYFVYNDNQTMLWQVHKSFLAKQQFDIDSDSIVIFFPVVPSIWPPFFFSSAEECQQLLSPVTLKCCQGSHILLGNFEIFGWKEP